MSEKRGPWFLFTGFLIGLALGLVYSLVINPVHYIDASPHSLDRSSKDRYRALIALVYSTTGDLGQAKARLDLLRDENEERALAALAQQEIAREGSQDRARALAQLSVDIKDGSTSSLAPEDGEAGLMPRGTPTPVLTETSIPTQTQTAPVVPTMTPLATFTPPVGAVLLPEIKDRFILADQRELCGTEDVPRLLEIEIADEDQNPIPGIQIDISWEGVTDTFFTGLYPLINTGYANFKMKEGQVYSLQIAQSDEVFRNLSVPVCKGGSGEAYPGGLWLKFSRK